MENKRVDLGKIWTGVMDEELKARMLQGQSLSNIADDMQRSPASIVSRAQAIVALWVEFEKARSVVIKMFAEDKTP